MYNKALMARVKARIAENPLELEMFSWWGSDEREDLDLEEFREAREIDRCGTTACIAGWVLFESGLRCVDDPPEGSSAMQTSDHIQNLAATALGVTFADVTDLFFVSDWPLSFKGRFYKASVKNDRREMAKTAVARIEEWERGIEARYEVMPDGDEIRAKLRGLFEIQEVT